MTFVKEVPALRMTFVKEVPVFRMTFVEEAVCKESPLEARP